MRKPLLTTSAVLLATGLVVLPGRASHAASCTGTAPGDFNGDGRADLAVGDSRASAAGAPSAGAVSVLYGADGGLGKARTVVLTAARPAAAEGFGQALATGYLNDDTCLDLAVGAPWANKGEGKVHVFYGSPDGLTPGDVVEPAAGSRRFGWSLAIAAGSGDQPALLAVGAPAQTVGGKANAGAVHLQYFRDGKIGRGQVITQDDERAEGVAEPGDLFGWSVALGRIRGDAGLDDLVVSEPLEDVDSEGTDVGSFSVVEDVYRPGGAKGEHWHYENLNLGAATGGGHIGWSLAYYKDADRAYVAVGAPGQKTGGKAGAGQVAILSSTGSGLKPEAPIDASAGGGDIQENGRFGWTVALGRTSSGVAALVGAPYGGAKETGTARLVPLGDRSGASKLDRGGEGGHLGWAVAFCGTSPLVSVPDDQEHPTGYVRIFGDGDTDLVPEQKAGGTVNADFGAGLA
ncbi:FG-GAP repeat protein [Actinocorallia longicatena]|uniref:FG-GAP repeat protein n=1 Tax=Actinocorallia longicatena TaxID=111803 RepID=A0ABP6QM72_9ACTN